MCSSKQTGREINVPSQWGDCGILGLPLRSHARSPKLVQQQISDRTPGVLGPEWDL